MVQKKMSLFDFVETSETIFQLYKTTSEYFKNRLYV